MPNAVPSSAPLPTIREVLGIAELAAGAPELVTGEIGLDRSVRWAHVVAGRDAPSLLDGGELVLATGTGWPDPEHEPEAYGEFIRTLIAADPAAIVIELGTGFHKAPPALTESCTANGIPLILLHRVVRFVQVTQRIHQRVLAAQNAALEARAEVHAMLTELGLNRSPVDYVVERIGATLGAPVVLEDAAGRVVAWSGTDASALAYWASEYRGPGYRPTPIPDGATSVPVEAQGTRWGRLIALAGPPHAAGRATVLELGAFALALTRLGDVDGDTWLDLSSKRLFDAVLEGRFSGDRELEYQLVAAGLPIQGRTLLGATLSGVGDFGAHETLETAILTTALRRAVAPDGHVLIAPITNEIEAGSTPGARFPASPSGSRTMLALLSLPLADARLAPGTTPSTNPFAERLDTELARMLPETTPPAWRAQLSIGVTATHPRALIASLERVAAGGFAGAQVTGTGPTRRGRVVVQLAEERPLAYLVRGLAAAPQLQEFALGMLDPLIAHDRGSGSGHSGDLVRVLGAYLAHPTNRSLAAQQARLSRSVFYQRIALIEELLQVDLTHGETIAALTVALLARGEM